VVFEELVKFEAVLRARERSTTSILSAVTELQSIRTKEAATLDLLRQMMLSRQVIIDGLVRNFEEEAGRLSRHREFANAVAGPSGTRRDEEEEEANKERSEETGAHEEAARGAN
jgi:hypothetical protein